MNIRPEPEELKAWRAELDVQVRARRRAERTTIVATVAAVILAAGSLYLVHERQDRQQRATFSLDRDVSQLDARVTELGIRLDVIDPDVLDQLLRAIAQQYQLTRVNQQSIHRIEREKARF